MQNKLRRAATALPLSAAVAAGAVAPADAADDYFLQMTGIQGESLDKNHKGEVDVLAFSWGVSAGKASRTRAAVPGFGELNVTKFVDQSSPLLFEKAADGTPVSSVKLHVVRAGATPITYLRYCLTDATVASVQQSAGGDRATESLSFRYASFTMRYTGQDPDGTSRGSVIRGWDVIRNLSLDPPPPC